MDTATGMTMEQAAQWARPAVAMLVAQIAATLTVKRLNECGCGASWHGPPGDPCRWCQEATARHVADQRQALLYPDWMLEQGPIYDQLTDVDKTVWDRTRGIQRGDASIAAWARRIVDAAHTGAITETEADAAMGRAQRWAT